ncbi:polysaccharide deacetylase family protein [Cellulomonas sp. McL0617]|uniref:polysaccharide deacetylase family protein n=1 Tax=Cellulomonas sp. McL0617 TaxID=3415675 RepID=UPI003CF26A78
MGEPPVHNICFHGIGDPGRAIDEDEARYWVTHNDFLRILDAIAPWPTLAISFDDGNASDVELGMPALQERGLTATFFVLAGRLDVPGSLASTDVVALRDAGMGIGSHGMDHVSWRSLTPDARQRELVDARDVISGIAGGVTEAALPRGQYDRTTLSWLRRLGYEAVYTSDRRPGAAGAWLQPRFSATRDDTAESITRAALDPRSAVERARLSLKGLVKRLR